MTIASSFRSTFLTSAPAAASLLGTSVALITASCSWLARAELPGFRGRLRQGDSLVGTLVSLRERVGPALRDPSPGGRTVGDRCDFRESAPATWCSATS